MAPLKVTSAIAAGAAKAPATAKAIRLFFMRSPFLISFKPVRRVNSPPPTEAQLRPARFNLSRERKKLPRFCQSATAGGKPFLRKWHGFRPKLLRIYNTALHKMTVWLETALFQAEQVVI